MLSVLASRFSLCRVAKKYSEKLSIFYYYMFCPSLVSFLFHILIHFKPPFEILDEATNAPPSIMTAPEKPISPSKLVWEPEPLIAPLIGNPVSDLRSNIVSLRP